MMIRNSVFTAFALGLILPVLCFAQGADTVEEPVFIDGVAAYVNEHVITVGDIVPIIQVERKRLYSQYQGDELAGRLKVVYDSALNLLIEKYLIVDSYEEQNLRIPDWVVDRRVTEIIHDNFGGDKSRLMDALEKDGLSYQEWWDETQQFIIVEVMKDTHLNDSVVVSPEEIKKEYEKNKGSYKVPGRVELRMIFLPAESEKAGAEAKKKAGSILESLRGGADFEKVAKKYSQEEHAEEGGYWGWIEPSVLNSELAGALKVVKAGQISKIIETADGFYILKVEDREEERDASLQEMQVQIGRKLRSEKMKEMYDAWMERLKKDAYVEIVQSSFSVN